MDRGGINVWKYITMVLGIVIAIFVYLFVASNTNNPSISPSSNQQSGSTTSVVTGGGAGIFIKEYCTNYSVDQCGVAADITMLNNTFKLDYGIFGGYSYAYQFAPNISFSELDFNSEFDVPLNTPFQIQLITNGGTISSVNVNSPYAIVSTKPNLPAKSPSGVNNVTVTLEVLKQTYNPLIVTINVTK